MTTESFGAILRRGRRDKGLSQAEFARAMDVSQQSVSRWEGGDVPPLAVLAKISQMLGIPLKALAAYERPGAPTLADRVRELEELARVLDAELAEVSRLVKGL